MKTSANQPAPESNRGAFIACVQHLQAGTSLAGFDQDLTELVRRVLATKRKGKIQLTLSIRPNAKHGVKVLDEVKLTLPKEEPSESFFYTTEDGQLLQNNPEGPNLPGLVLIPGDTISAPNQPVVLAR